MQGIERNTSNGGNEMTQQLIVLKSKRSEYKAADAGKKSVTVGELIVML